MFIKQQYSVSENLENLVRFWNRTKLGSALFETMLFGDPLYYQRFSTVYIIILMNENHLLKELSNSLSTRAKIDVQEPSCVPLRAAEKSSSIQVAVKTQRALLSIKSINAEQNSLASGRF